VSFFAIAISSVVARFCFRCDEFSGRNLFCCFCAHHLTGSPPEELLCESDTAKLRALPSIYAMLHKNDPVIFACEADVLAAARQESENYDACAARDRVE